VNHVFAKEPAVAELVVPFYELYSVALGQAQFIGAAGCEVVWENAIVSIRGIARWLSAEPAFFSRAADAR
jgi:hypothetical protein